LSSIINISLVAGVPLAVT